MLPEWPLAPAKSPCCRSSSSAPPLPSGSRTATPSSAPLSSSYLPSSSWSSAGRRQGTYRGLRRAPLFGHQSSCLILKISAAFLTLAITSSAADGVQRAPSPHTPRQPTFATGAGRATKQQPFGLRGEEAASVAPSGTSSRLLRLRGGHEKECGCGKTTNEWVTDQVGCSATSTRRNVPPKCIPRYKKRCTP